MKNIAAAALYLLLSSSMAWADSAEKIWKSKCKSCHGEDGAGHTKVGRKEKIDDLSNPQWQKRHSDEFIRKVIAEGSSEKPKMKAYKDKLTTDEIASLVDFVRSLEK